MLLLAAAVALAAGWRYLPRGDAVPGGGPAAVRDAGPSGAMLVACDRRTGVLLIGTQPIGTRFVRVKTDGAERATRVLHGDGGSTLVPVSSGSMLADGLAGERRPLVIAFDRDETIVEPSRAVGRVVRECRSLTPARQSMR